MAEQVNAQRMEQMLEEGGIILLDIFTETCPPCRALAPTIDKLSEEYAGRVSVVKMDGAVEREFTSALGVSSVPTVILYVNGSEVDRMMGLRPENYYAKKLNDALESILDTDVEEVEDGLS